MIGTTNTAASSAAVAGDQCVMTPREVAQNTVERIQKRIVGRHFRLSDRMKLRMRDLIQGEIEEAIQDALAPFAYICGEGDEDFPDNEPVKVTFGRTTYRALTLGDLRRAASLVADHQSAASSAEEGVVP